MKTSFSFIVFLFLILYGQAQQNENQYSVLFYNVENLFDIKNDSITDDDEFTPEGERHWTYKRLNVKLQNTAKIILSLSEWKVPTLVGLCEIENRYVLEKLLKETPLKTVPYKIIHKESPDFRGIDVALLYNDTQFYPLNYEYYPLIKRNGEMMNSREILYVSGVMGGVDTIHVFVNHWPSRYSGVMETRELRKEAASLLHAKIELVLKNTPDAKIIVLGDFNDQPNDDSIEKCLQAQAVTTELVSHELYNLSEDWEANGQGTLKYQSQWFVFDQVIVSGAMLVAKEGLYAQPEWATICKLPYLLESDEKYGGFKPKRTYTGYKYNGGFSDHLPVLLKLQVR
ncbi:endonuclease [Prolixibacteraceae bacterium Z1-6]|uniref:Endonuclease n=1 Tax=Draconibacterium aestuarii TaxID=2998507 RepID=A0A9X3J6V2_9BACT|nr:endonuclease [Prolixibacteraceae bacterium Z1-6]